MTHPPRPEAPTVGAEATAWSAWLGREERHAALVSADQAALFESSLDRLAPAADEPLAPLRHWMWLFAPPAIPTARLDPDGHPPRGPLVPTWPLPRRMWAGSSLTWLAPVAPGSLLERHSSVLAVELKSGRSGTLGFLTLQHRWHNRGQCAIDERQTVVYREAASGTSPSPVPPPAPPTPAAIPASASEPAAGTDPAPGGWGTVHTPGELLLFRYSALTFNAHRIHYDRTYATRTEGYPDLVVHGPLMATLMIDAFRDAHPRARLRSFSFRALAPAFVGGPLVVGGEPTGDGRASLWVRSSGGAAHLTGEVAFD